MDQCWTSIVLDVLDDNREGVIHSDDIRARSPSTQQGQVRRSIVFGKGCRIATTASQPI